MRAPHAITVTRRRSRYIIEPPSGLRYVPAFLTVGEEHRLLSEIEVLRFEAVRMHGVVARREVVHFGARYEFTRRSVAAANPFPSFLQALYQRTAVQAGFAPAALAQALVTRYPSGAGIGWHRDAPSFDAVVAGISLGASCEMRFRRETSTGYDVYRQELAPRSLYLFSGSARFNWQHMIPPVEVLRYSVTFRTVREATSLQ